MSTTTPFGEFQSGLLTERPPPRNQSDAFFARDVGPLGTLYQTTIDLAGALVWISVSGLGSGWDKYVVSNATPNGPTTLYSTIAAAIAAAIADGRGPASPATVLVLPGTYTEDLTFVSDIHLVGLGSGGSQDASPRVVVVGNHTAPDIEGFLLIEGIEFQSDAGTQLAIAGFKPAKVQIHRCRFVSTGAITRCIDMTNTQAASTLLLDDCRLLPDAAAPNALNSNVAPVALVRTTVQLADAAITITLPPASFDRITGCDILGGISKVGGTLVMRDVRLDCVKIPTIFGAAVMDFQDVVSPNAIGITVGAGATFTLTREWHTHTLLMLSGAGPHNLTGNLLADLITVDAASTSNLPSVADVPDGVRFAIRNISLVPAVVAVTPVPGDTVDFIAPVLNLTQGQGTILQASRASLTWIQVARV